MNILNHYGTGVNRRHIEEAVEALRNGEIIIYPTDTLYAYGCDATNNRAIERLCALKGINPEKNLLSIVCANLSQAAVYARIDNRAFSVLKEYLPGPFTFILPSSPKLPKIFKGRRQVGIRIPDCDIATALAEELGNPLMSSSVALSDEDREGGFLDGELTAEQCTDPNVTVALVTEPCGIDVSTIVDLSDPTDPTIVRQGKGQF